MEFHFTASAVGFQSSPLSCRDSWLLLPKTTTEEFKTRVKDVATQNLTWIASANALS